MGTVVIEPSKLNGKIKVPSSKSLCHRNIICSALANGKSTIKNVCLSNDILATIKAMRNLGSRIEVSGDILVIHGIKNFELKNRTICCGESGSTLRFIIPLVSLLNEDIILTGRGKLVERPLNVYYRIFDEQNIYYKNSNGKLPLTIRGKLKAGNYKVRGDISSQFITGLLFALPLLDENSEISLTTSLESRPYVDITLDVLKRFGINIKNIKYKKFIIYGNQSYKSCDCTVEGDFSQAAFLLLMGILGEKISCEGLDYNSSQGDKVIIDLLKKMGASIDMANSVIVSKASETHGITIDASQCPDLVPALAALASVSLGTTRIINAQRLRIKESDRLAAISSQLNIIGADVQEKRDGLLINGKKVLNGGEVSSFNDHRIAMALAGVSSKCMNHLIIKDADCVNKSYPDFWRDFKKLGGKIKNI